MTCFIATENAVLAAELYALAEQAGLNVVQTAADLLLLDLDAPKTAPSCGVTWRFSATDADAEYARPFSYRKFLDDLKQFREKTGGKIGNGRMIFAGETFTATEKRLLDALMEAEGGIVTAGELALKVFGDPQCHNELKVYILHLRQKIEEPSGIRLIETIRGVGYRFRSDRTVAALSERGE